MVWFGSAGSDRARLGKAMSAPDVPGLLAALIDLCKTFGCDAASASCVSPLGGKLVTLHCTRGGVAYVADEEGNVVVVPPGASE